MINFLRTRRRLVSGSVLALALLGAGSAQAYRMLDSDCCAPGSPCCYPGSPCCHHAAPGK
jgi:hypothetical protein